MDIHEKCTCGASISVENPGTEVTEDMRNALADFRVGHRCPTGAPAEKAVTGGIPTSTTPF